MSATEEVRDPTEAEVSLEDWIQRNQRIQDVAVMDGWTLITDYVKARLGAAQNKLAFGKALDWNDYQRTSAEAQAYLWFLGIPQEMVDKVQTLRAQMAEDKVDDDE